VARTGERYEDEEVNYAYGEIAGAYEISAFQTAPNRMAVFFRDITERRRSEQALRASEEKFAKAFYTSPDAININRLVDGIYLDINYGFTEITGFTRDDVIGRSSLDDSLTIWVHPKDRQYLVDALHARGELLGYEAEFRCKSGKILTGLMSAKLIEINGEQCVLSITRDITESKLAARNLQESEEKYRFLFDTMSQGVVLQDAETRIIEANRAASAILGVSMELLLGKSSFDTEWMLVHEDYSPFLPEDMPSNIALRTGKPVRDIVCGVYHPASHDYHWILISSVPRYLDGAAKPTVTMTTFTNITALKRTEEALKTNEERLSLVIRNSPDLIYILDQDLRYIWAPKIVLNLTSEETIGKTDHDFFSPAEADRLDAINRKVLATGETVRYEKCISLEQGTLYYDNIALPWRDAKGQITGVVIYAHDITERKRAEEILRNREALLRAVVDNAPFEFWARDMDGRVIMVNKALVDHWGDLLGQRLEEAGLLPDELAKWQENNRRAYAGELVQVEAEYTVAGEQRVFQNIVAPIYADGCLQGIMGFNIDITERKRADRAKNQFLMVLSHELKTPLTSIIGWGQLAQDAPDIVPEALATILRNAHQQKLLLERLLILSRILTGKLTLTRRPTDLWQLAVHVEQELHHAAEERNITIDLEPPGEELVMNADEKLLQQAICEVIDNAINFTPPGGRIMIQGHREEEMDILTVQDTGQGIAPEQLSARLKPFSQIQRKEEIGGLGIGLALVRGIVEAHGGQVTLASAGPGQGTIVTLRFPHSRSSVQEEHRTP